MDSSKNDQSLYINKNKKCSVDGCENDARCKTYCSKHYSRFSKTGNPLKTLSGKEHGIRSICIIDGCGGIVEGHGYCRKHYKKWRKYGDPLMVKNKPHAGRYTKEGYVLIKKPDWPTIRSDGYILEHRWVMEKKLGRSLKKNEIVHHKNGVRNDNREENLEVMSTKGHHKGSEPIICPHCGKPLIVK